VARVRYFVSAPRVVTPGSIQARRRSGVVPLLAAFPLAAGPASGTPLRRVAMRFRRESRNRNNRTPAGGKIRLNQSEVYRCASNLLSCDDASNIQSLRPARTIGPSPSYRACIGPPGPTASCTGYSIPARLPRHRGMRKNPRGGMPMQQESKNGLRQEDGYGNRNGPDFSKFRLAGR
jgi:hypothetical protein